MVILESLLKLSLVLINDSNFMYKKEMVYFTLFVNLNFL
jgi:hypothetical protein